MADRLRRRQDDHRAARPAHAPLRDHRDRQRELALQEPRLTLSTRARSGPEPPPQPDRSVGSGPDLAEPRGVKIGRRSGVSFGSRLTEKLKTNPDGYHTWNEEEVERFLDRHGPGTKARLVILLALNTGMARQDLARVGRQHVKAGRIAYRRGKTSVAADLPILPELAVELEAALANWSDGQMLFITQDKRPVGYTPESLGNWFRDRCAEANVPGALHGLRKAGATRLAYAGATEWEIASYLAHKDTKTAAIYVKKANRARLADSGFAKLTQGNVSNLSEVWDRKAGKANATNSLQEEVAARRGVEPLFPG
ncbi:tyrosine-type recombinase/integrase [Cereibacter azotoformans]|uniref:tyrosine-type recombinase/integrase n=1 Tax=Cereibacter azotoformans TaxID=43057 RepID=UPI003B21726D